MRFDRVVSYHLNPYTCGVARFNQSLANALGVKMYPLFPLLDTELDSALLSIKCQELSDEHRAQLLTWLRSRHRAIGGLFLHGLDESPLEGSLLRAALRVFAASHEIGERIRHLRQDTVDLFAPGAPVSPSRSSAEIRLLTFGMAHKIRSAGYQRLAHLIAKDPRTFELQISTALHEGGTFNEELFAVNNEIRSAFSGHVQFLGFLSDEEVSHRLRETSCLVAFFERGVRENNTTVLSAMAHGCPVLTNLDSMSPQWMQHGSTVLDIQQLETFPQVPELRVVGQRAADASREYSFLRLAALLNRDF